MAIAVQITLVGSTGRALYESELLYLAQQIAALSGPALPPSPTVSGRLSSTDAGLMIQATGNLIVSANTFRNGDCVNIRNTTGAPITLTQDTGLTLELAGTSTTGDRTVASKGVAILFFNSPISCSASGAGVT